MHVAVNKMFSESETEFVDPTINKAGDFKALLDFANTSESNRQIDIAAKYHLERISKFEDNIAAW